MIKNIIFDIGRVLIGFEWMDYVRSIFDEETAQAVTSAIWRTGHWSKQDIGYLGPDEMLDLFIGSSPEYEAQIREAYGRVGECVQRRDWAIPWIEHFREEGYRTYYLSNFSEYVYSANPEALDFLPLMDGGVFSYQEHVIKPDPRIYEILLERFDLPADECLFIDDHPENIEAAQALGMHGVLFTEPEETRAAVDEYLRQHRT